MEKLSKIPKMGRVVYQSTGFSSCFADSDQHDFGPPGSGSITTSTDSVFSYESGSRSFYNQAKKSKKKLNSYCFVTFFMTFFSLKSDVNNNF